MPPFAVSALCFAGSTLLSEIQNRRLRKQNTKLAATVLAEAEMILYLSNLIDNHEIPITEFDRIVINEIAAKVDKS